MAKGGQKFSPKLLIIVVVLLAVIGVGAYMLMGKGDYKNTMMQSGDNAFASIRDALSKSVSLECDVVDESGNTTKAYIKNGAIRADITSSDPNQSGSLIMKDKMMHTWSGSEGVKMQLPEGNYDVEAQPEGDFSQGDELINDLEEYKDNCRPAVVDDSLFTPPSDVTFMDMSSMMEGEMNEDELRQMMEMYEEQ